MEDKIKSKIKDQRSKIAKLLRVWLRIVWMTTQWGFFTNASGGLIFLVGKIVRLILFFVFLRAVVSPVGGLVGYTPAEVILYFLVFNLVDIIVQFFFRGVYSFRQLVITGDYDLDLLKPLPTFFRPIFGWTDMIDGVTLMMLIAYFPYYLITNNIHVSVLNMILFLFFIINSLFLAFSFHLIVCAICILTTEIDHLIWIYRDLTNMTRFPLGIYPVGIRIILTFVIPAAILISIPAEILLGLLNWRGAILAIVVTGVFFILSKKFWRFALLRYSSASS